VAAAAFVDDTANPIAIGANESTGSTRLYLGQMSEVRVWNATRTQEEIQFSMNKKLTGTETGLVGYWRLNDGTGTTAVATKGTNGTLVNFPANPWSTLTPDIYTRNYKGFTIDYSFNSIKSTLNAGYDNVEFNLPREFDNYGAGQTIGLDGYELQIVGYNDAYPLGKTLFKGDSIIIDSSVNENETVKVTAAGVIERLNSTPFITAAGAYEVSYSATALETIFKDVINRYNQQNPRNIITYSNATIGATGRTATIKFNNANCLGVLTEIFQLTDSNWVWFVDVDDVAYLKPISTTPDHKLFFGKDIKDLQRTQDKTKIVNNLLFWNGATSGSIARRYTKQDSVDTYGIHTKLKRDGRFTLAASMDLAGSREVNVNSLPNDQITISVLGLEGGGYDIDSIKVGDVIKILNVGTDANIGNSLVVSTKTDYLEYCTLVCFDRETFVSRELANLKSDVNKVNYEAGPTTYTAVPV
jgi:hypothetical protein